MRERESFIGGAFLVSPSRYPERMAERAIGGEQGPGKIVVFCFVLFCLVFFFLLKEKRES